MYARSRILVPLARSRSGSVALLVFQTQIAWPNGSILVRALRTSVPPLSTLKHESRAGFSKLARLGVHRLKKNT